MFGSNFNPKARMDGNDVNLSGDSVLLDDAELIMRHVSLQQDARVAHGPAPLAGKWTVELPLPADPFEPGRAVATGVETYFAAEPTPAFVTFTWSQDVTIVGSSAA